MPEETLKNALPSIHQLYQSLIQLENPGFHPVQGPAQNSIITSSPQISQSAPALSTPIAAPVKAMPASRLLSLPGEIRELIYKHLFSSTRTVGFKEVQRSLWDWQFTAQFQHPNSGRPLTPVDLSILRANKLIHDEVANLFFSKHTFVVTLDESEWLDARSQPFDIRKIQSLTLKFGENCMESPDFNGEYSEYRSYHVDRAAEVFEYAINLALTPNNAIQQIVVELPTPCLQWLRQVVMDYVRECHVAKLKTYSAGDLLWRKSFTSYFLQLDDEVVLHGMFPFLDRATIRFAMSRLKLKNRCAMGRVDLEENNRERSILKGDAFRIALNNTWWDELEDGCLSSADGTQCGPEEFPRALFAMIHKLWNTPVWSNGKLIWKHGMAMEPGYERTTQFDPPYLDEVIKEAIRMGWITIHDADD